MIQSSVLAHTINDAIAGRTTWLDAASPFPADELIAALLSLRAGTEKSISDLDDAAVCYNAGDEATWSISQYVTQLISTQNIYENVFHFMTEQTPPLVYDAAATFVIGRYTNVPAKDLRRRLYEATLRIGRTFTYTYDASSLPRSIIHPLFGTGDYKTWVLYLIMHEMDNARQVRVMRRMAFSASRTAFDLAHATYPIASQQFTAH